jgi:photosystem II stability/assembly factor-like uncharacterized protein
MKSFLFLFVGGLLVFGGCETGGSSPADNRIITGDTNTYWPNDEVNHCDPRVGLVLKESDQKWVAREVNIASGISQIYFADEKQGWAISRNVIYETTDGGSGWTVIDADLDLVGYGDEIAQLEFDTSGEGWLALQHYGGKERSRKDGIKVLRSRDRGRTWQLSLSIASARFSDMHNSGRNTWLLGTTIERNDPQQRVPLIIVFSDERNGWANISRTFNKYLNHDNNKYFNYPDVSKIGISDSNCLVVAAEDRTAFQSCDLGRSWKLINGQADPGHPERVNEIHTRGAVCHLLVASGGVEGTGSSLKMFDVVSGIAGKSVDLPGYYLKRAAWLSENEIIVAGIREEDPSIGADKEDQKKRNVILQTKDGGKTWSEVFSQPFDWKPGEKNGGNFFLFGGHRVWLIDETRRTYRIARPEE